ncbi:MAG TPA: hypothetical protein VFX95_01015 [Caulobacteraceae bacterium]|nr:hypothetical protein [Caulobacteraceae bacterium]
MTFLVGCAVLGLFMGLRGALPGNVDPDYASDAPLSAPSGVVVEAAPVTDNAPVVTNDTATNDVEEEEEAAEEEVRPAPEPEPEPDVPATPAPKEEPPADPVGDLIETPSAPPPPLSDLY